MSYTPPTSGSCTMNISGSYTVQTSGNLTISLADLDIDVSNTYQYFIFTLTGTEDSTTDVEIPITNFQFRKRADGENFLSVTVPTLDYADEIADRPNGSLKLEIVYKQSGEIISTQELISVDFDTPDLYTGSSSESVILSGYRDAEYSADSVTIEKSTYRRLYNGTYRHRLAELNTSLEPGDTVTISDDTFVVDTISGYLSANGNLTMEIAEAA